MDADILAIAAALDEEENLAIAQKMQEEAYMGNLSARGGGGAADSQPMMGGMGMPQQPMGHDDHGIPAARPQVMDQMIGGDDGPMDVDEYSSSANVPRDNFGAGARDNFPSGF